MTLRGPRNSAPAALPQAPGGPWCPLPAAPAVHDSGDDMQGGGLFDSGSMGAAVTPAKAAAPRSWHISPLANSWNAPCLCIPPASSQWQSSRAGISGRGTPSRACGLSDSRSLSRSMASRRSPACRPSEIWLSSASTWESSSGAAAAARVVGQGAGRDSEGMHRSPCAASACGLPLWFVQAVPTATPPIYPQLLPAVANLPSWPSWANIVARPPDQQHITMP